MTARDRTVIMIVLALGAIVAGWFLVVSPKRSQASSLSTQITSEQSQLTAAEGQVAAGMSARRAFAGQYAQLAKLGEAVPPDDDIPSLIYQVQSAAQAAHVSFRGLQLTGGGRAARLRAPSSSSSSTAARRRPPTAAQLPPGASVGAAGLPTEQFTVTLSGNYFNLSNFFNQPRELRGQRQRHADDPRPADVDQRDQPRARPDRLPADHRDRLGDDLHRPADARARSVARRRPAPRRPPSPRPRLPDPLFDLAARCGVTSVLR